MACMKKLTPLVLLILLLTACGPSSTPAPASKAATVPASSGYPAPAASSPTKPGYPAPSNGGSTEEAASPTATIDPALGQVKGVFHLEKIPDMPFVLYLAPTVKDSKGQEIVVNFNRDISIPAVPDRQGNFTFVNVPPGRYGLVYDAIGTSFLMTVPGKQETLIITVNGNETVNLGQLNYEAPPE